MRLIDADNLIPMIKYATIDKEIGIYPIRIGFDAIKKVIDEMPTIEVEPVKHGEWKWVKAPKGADFSFYQCSICGEARWLREKYCANCGARMEGAEE